MIKIYDRTNIDYNYSQISEPQGKIIGEIKELLKCDSISCVLRSCVECKSKAIFKNGYRKQGDVIKEVIEYLLNLSKGQGNVVFDIDLIDYALKKGVEL